MLLPCDIIQMSDFEKALKRCIRCGACMSVCPVYQTTRIETDAARGKLAVLAEVASGKLDLFSHVSKILSRCLSCGACSEVCANNVRPDSLIRLGREMDFARHGPRLSQRLLETITRNDLEQSRFIKSGMFLEKLLCKSVPESSGLYMRFPLSFFTERTSIPQISRRSFFETCSPEERRAAGRLRVGYFVGCGANYLFPEQGHALLGILRKMDISPFIPERQGCCGLMAQSAGDRQRAVSMARHAIDLFAETRLDYIITTCASCGAQLKAFPELFHTEAERERAEAFSDKVLDATDFLINVIEYDKTSQSSAQRQDRPLIRVVYHDPCHLRIKQKVMEAPRRLLSSIPGIELLEFSTPGQCCGHGGAFNLGNFPISMQILDRKMSEIEKLQPDKIVTGCTGCLLQFQQGIERIKIKKKIEVLHPLQLL
jgi:glycolate oxidase iron-sulfur subunit